MAEMRWTNNSARHDALEREDEDLGQVQGEFYRVLRPKEAPFWLREKAEQHMMLLSTLLQIPPEPIVWFVPALDDEVPEDFIWYVHDSIVAAPDNAPALMVSGDDVSLGAVNSEYIWLAFEVLGFAMRDVRERGIFLRADLPLSGWNGLDFTLARRMKQRQQAHQRALDSKVWRSRNECTRDADEFACLYMEAVVLGQDEALRLSPEMAAMLVKRLHRRTR